MSEVLLWMYILSLYSLLYLQNLIFKSYYNLEGCNAMQMYLQPLNIFTFVLQLQNSTYFIGTLCDRPLHGGV